ncbi:MAG: bis(5'-nucleosyl)-tetraphosphatase (symmetrical) YqeK [Microcoleaceae cyanobacterium]
MSQHLDVEELRPQVLAWLADNVPERRIQHILGVEQMAVALAQRHHLDQTQAQLAALMHDLAKYFKPKVLLKMAHAGDVALDPILETHPKLLHADVGAIVAQQEFQIHDPEILEAIANHTLGQPNMSLLSCVIFLADTLEPGRGDTPELNHLRQVCDQNLLQAVWETSDYTLQYLIQQGQVIHPRAVLTRNWALHAVKIAP